MKPTGRSSSVAILEQLADEQRAADAGAVDQDARGRRRAGAAGTRRPTMIATRDPTSRKASSAASIANTSREKPMNR